MYVNHWTLDYGERGRESIRRFLGQAFERDSFRTGRNWNLWFDAAGAGPKLMADENFHR